MIKGITENSLCHLIVVEFYTSSNASHVVLPWRNYPVDDFLQIYRLKFNNFDLTSRVFSGVLNSKIGAYHGHENQRKHFTFKKMLKPVDKFAYPC